MARRTGDVSWRVTSGGAALMICFAAALAGRADTLNGALVNAYQNNPQLNSKRSVVRATVYCVGSATLKSFERLTGEFLNVALITQLRTFKKNTK
jgi:hypothetical protein